jgi:HKD family nuclease
MGSKKMEIDFIGTPLTSLDKEIETLLMTSDKISISLDYITEKGVDFILKCIPCEKEKAIPEISIVTGTDLYFNENNEIKELTRAGVKCYASMSENFHSKLYIFEKNDDVTVITGSSKLNEGNSGSSIEACAMLKGKASDDAIPSVMKYFSFLLSESLYCKENQIKSQEDHKQNYIENSMQDNADLEVFEKELNEIPIDGCHVLSENETYLLEASAVKLKEADLAFKKGNVHEAIFSIREAYDNLMNLEETNSISALIKKSECNVGLSRAFCEIGKEKEAHEHAKKAEIIGKKLYFEAGYVYPYLLGLKCAVQTESSDEKKEQKCNEFIEIFDANKEEIAEFIYDNPLFGKMFHLSSLAKFKNDEFDLALTYIEKSLSYLRNDLMYEPGFYNSINGMYNDMMCCRYLCHSYELYDCIGNTSGQHCLSIRNYSEEALNIAINELNSDFWEGIIRLEVARHFIKSTNNIPVKLTFNHLQKAKKIFTDLNYPELIEQVDETTDLIHGSKSAV